MKKYFVSFLLLLVAPSICFGSSARYTQLVREKQRKMEQLEKCMGSNKKLQIAGISTLGLTAVGVAGNIAEAKMIKDNTKKIASQEETIEDKKIELAQKQQDKAEADAAAAAAALEEYNDTHTLEFIVSDDIKTISASGGNIGDKAISHGYQPEQLPSGLRNSFGNAMGDFIKNCFALQGTKNIKTVSAGAKSESEWRAFSGDGTLKESDVLKSDTPYEIAECKAVTCDDHYYPTDAGCVPEATEEVDDPASKPQPAVTSTSVTATNGDGSVAASQSVSAGTPDPSTPVTDVTGGEEPGNTQVTDTPKAPEEEAVKTTETKTAATTKKCSAKALNAANAKDGVVEGKKCKVTSCKGNLVKSDDELSCKCPSDKPKLNKKTMMCSAEKPAATVVEEKKTTADVSTWTEEQRKANPGEYCKNHFLGRTISESGPAYNCCMEIVKGKATTYSGTKGKETCNCKDNAKWENNKCVADTSDPKNWTQAQKKANPDKYCKSVYGHSYEEDCCMEILAGNATKYKESNNTCDCKEGKWERIDHGYHCVRKDTYFKDVTAEAMDACKGFVKLYGKHKNMNLTFVNSKIEAYDHYLYYKTKVGKYDKYYAFKFNLCENVGGDTMPAFAIRGTLDTLCKMYGGNPSWQDWAGATGHVCPLSNKEAVQKEVDDFLGKWYFYTGSGFMKSGKHSRLESLYYKF